MKRVVLLFCFLGSILLYSNHLVAQKVSLEEIKQQCANVPYNQRVRLSVSSFDVATLSNPGQFGSELAQMLTNALQNVNCFNVLLSIKDSKALTDEISFGQAGNTAAGTSPATGKMKGAQVLVLGKVTEYSSGEKKTSAFGISVTGGNKAHIGFIVQLVNAETREVIDSRSINVEGKMSGFSGGKLFGVNIAGATNNKSLQDACEKGIAQAVEFIASKKDQMPLPEANSGTAVKKFDASNCTMLKASYVPKIMVILPEFHITQRIPDPAGETEINRRLVEAGFPVVDPAMYASLRNGVKFNEAARDPAKAVSLGREFGADIVIYGEAFSQRTGTQGSQVTCRARVEVRAVKTDDATMVATNGLEAGALDNAEFVAAKSALRSAASLVADYMLDQFCSKNIAFAKASSSGRSVAGKGMSTTEINLQNADFQKLKSISDLLSVKGKVIEKNIAGGNGYIKVEYPGTVDNLAELIDSKLGSKFNIKEFGSGKILLAAK